MALGAILGQYRSVAENRYRHPMQNAFLLRKPRKSAPWLILGLGCILSAWVAMYVDAQIDRDAGNIFHQHVRDFETSLARNFDKYDNILFGVAGMYQNTHDVTREQFDQYGASLNIQERYGALKSVNFARLVDMSKPDQMREALSDQADAAVIRTAAAALPSKRTQLMVITRVYPPTSPGLGADIFTNFQKHFSIKPSVKKSWMETQAYEANKVISSGLPVHRPGGLPLVGLAARLGIFKKEPDGHSRLIGTAGIGFDLKAFFAEAMPASLTRKLQFQMVNLGRANGQTSPKPILVFDSNGAKIGGAPGSFSTQGHFAATFDIVFGGALLRTTVSEARNDLVSGRDRALPFLIFAAGAMLSGLLALLSWRLLDQNAFLQSTVKKKNAALQLELQQKQVLEQQLAHSAAEERRRIGRELHDDLGQRLTGISLSAEALAAQLQATAPQLAPHADALERQASQAISCVRDLAHGLMPVPSGAQGLREALANLARDVSSLTKTACAFDYDDPVEVADEDVATNLYRIAQEALNNAIRHGKASQVSIHLDYVGAKSVLHIADNGAGFNPDDAGHSSQSGSGLKIMQYRASVSGYALSIESAIGRGTIIKVTEC